MSFGRPDHEQELSYGSYLRVADILAQQQLRSDPAQHDELLFIVIHQVYELWFKQILHEVDGVVARLQRDDVLGATRLVRRCIEIQRVLVSQITVLETMSPTDFLTFRDHIMPASGFQSAQFREIEFVSGLKDPGMLVHARPTPDERARLQARLDNPSVREVMYDVFRRRGFDLPVAPDDADEVAKNTAHARRVSQLATIYRDQANHFDLFLLCEALVEYDEMFTLWRLRHVQMVERVIGWKPGTGGSSGAAYLRTTVERKFFPELWDLRTHLGAPAV